MNLSASKLKSTSLLMSTSVSVGVSLCAFLRALANGTPLERYLGRLLDLDAPSLNIPLLPVEAALRIINDYAEAPIATGFPEVDSALQQARAMHVMVETTRHSAAQLAHLEAQGGPVASDELFKQVAKAVVDKHHEDTKENIRFMQPFCESSWRKPSAVRSFPKQFACRSDANLASIDGRGGIHAQAERALRKGRPFWDLFC